MDTFQNKTPEQQQNKQPEEPKQMETTTFFKKAQIDQSEEKSKERLAKISALLNYFNQNYVFEDKPRSNFLLHLFSTKLQNLYDNLDVSDSEFENRINLLNESLKEIAPYSL